MTVAVLRILIYTAAPLVLAGALLLIDTTVASRERRLEAVLIFLFSLGVAGSGLGGFAGHLFLSDVVAESIGWEPGSPFQREMGFANLALGVLGLVATGRRDGFREATVIAVTVVGVGATIVHALDIIATGNLAPGNTVQNISNLLKPALLIAALRAARRAEAARDSEAGSAAFEQWRQPLIQLSGIATACIASAFGIGFALDRAAPATLLGLLLSLGLLVDVVRRAPRHQARWQREPERRA